MNSRCTVACLHSRKGCYRGKPLSFASYDLVYENFLKEGTYTRYCRVCFPRDRPKAVVQGEETTSSEDDEESTSDSDS